MFRLRRPFFVVLLLASLPCAVPLLTGQTRPERQKLNSGDLPNDLRLAGTIASISDRTALVTVNDRANTARRYEFQVREPALRRRLRAGQPVTVNLRTATAQFGGQTVRLTSVITDIAVAPKVEMAQFCAMQQAGLNAVDAGLPPGTPSAHYTCQVQAIPGTNGWFCLCRPSFF